MKVVGNMGQLGRAEEFSSVFQDVSKSKQERGTSKILSQSARSIC